MDALNYVLVVVLAGVVVWLAKSRAALRKEVAQLKADLAAAQAVPTEGAEQSPLQGTNFILIWLCCVCEKPVKGGALYQHILAEHPDHARVGPVDVPYEEVLAGSTERVVVRSVAGEGSWCERCGRALEWDERTGNDYCPKCGVVQYS